MHKQSQNWSGVQYTLNKILKKNYPDSSCKSHPKFQVKIGWDSRWDFTRVSTVHAFQCLVWDISYPLFVQAIQENVNGFVYIMCGRKTECVANSGN